MMTEDAVVTAQAVPEDPRLSESLASHLHTSQAYQACGFQPGVTCASAQRCVDDANDATIGPAFRFRGAACFFLIAEELQLPNKPLSVRKLERNIPATLTLPPGSLSSLESRTTSRSPGNAYRTPLR